MTVFHPPRSDQLLKTPREHKHKMRHLVLLLLQSVHSASISGEEMVLLDINPPRDTIDQFWIRQTEELIAVRVKSIQDTLAAETKKFAEVQRSIRDTGLGLKDIVILLLLLG